MSVYRRNFILGVVGTLFVIALIILRVYQNSPKTISRKILDMLEAGEYQQAAAEFEKSYGTDEAYSFSALCEAFEKYDAGNIWDATTFIHRWKYFRKTDSKVIYPEETLKMILEFRDKVEGEYSVLLAEQVAKNAEASMRLQQERDKIIISGLPYVGMSEVDIKRTSLGAPSRSEYIKDKFGDGMLGFYFWDQGNKVLFIARTKNGKVYSVTDMRTVRGGDWDKQPKKTTQPETDPYDVYNYDNPEDFYDEHYDEFFDYYEAEDYWEDHQ